MAREGAISITKQLPIRSTSEHSMSARYSASVGEARDDRGVAIIQRCQKGRRTILASERVRCTDEAGSFRWREVSSRQG
jgi:hypothetical protein